MRYTKPPLSSAKNTTGGKYTHEAVVKSNARLRIGIDCVVFA